METDWQIHGMIIHPMPMMWPKAGSTTPEENISTIADKVSSVDAKAQGWVFAFSSIAKITQYMDTDLIQVGVHILGYFRLTFRFVYFGVCDFEGGGGKSAVYRLFRDSD
ncbi:hypothetical protein [Xenorhabdus bovienii]|uniref:Uncharacterized protein n=1 Tax=Xenorhabdus bovienii str. kraussei Becker Underwood TaxID=1398204 RepID=A0A077PR76_XENBV|nr:hypothetical protein [Xenorhabdus bovienii]CDH26810.1 hypothetical protein XBKB1_940039 [Xenorhabdus bovienii str. kraussei Becker Underwood]